ncbi:MAG TPA: helix-turn-helix transcriptional regulator [Streptosporangiaceae bacterium]|nr:helix-turn-helix transcriptional regulator [Streptosporangiaceae bacterium]
MPLGEKIRQLRAERRWSQADLAGRLGSNDAAAISRYENGKMTPAVDAVIRLAEILDVSTDYLLIDGAPRRRFGDPGDEFTERIGLAARLSAADKAAIAHIIDGLLANSRIRAALDEAR